MTEEAKPVDGIDNQDYSEGYKKNIEALKNKPEMLAFNKACFDMESTKEGAALMDMLEERFLLPALINPNHPDFTKLLPYYEGVRDMVRTIKMSSKAHEAFIEYNKG